MESIVIHTKLILILFGIASVLVTCIATWVRLTERQKVQDEKIEANEQGVASLGAKVQTALYDDKSMPIFTPRSECDKVRIDCTKNILGSIERISMTHQTSYLEVRQELKEMRVEIKENERLRLTGMVVINTSVATIAQAVKDIKEHNKHSIEDIKKEIRKGNGGL